METFDWDLIKGFFFDRYILMLHQGEPINIIIITINIIACTGFRRQLTILYSVHETKACVEIME